MLTGNTVITFFVNERPFDIKRFAKSSKTVLKKKVFRYTQVNTKLPDELP